MADNPELLTYRETAALLAVSLTTIYRWTRPGPNGEAPLLRALKMGPKTVRIRRADALAILERATPPGEVTTPSDRHPTTTGPDYRDADGNPARLVLCPDCGQMEWWTEAECNDHGKCRASNAPCWCEVRP